MNKIKEKIKSYIENKKKEWKLCLYLNGVLVKTLRVNEEYVPTDKFYKITLINKKHIVGTNKKVKLICEFDKYKMTDTDKRELHIEVKVNKGVDIR